MMLVSTKNYAKVKIVCFCCNCFFLHIRIYLLFLAFFLQVLQLLQSLIVAAVVYLLGKSLLYVPDH